MVKRIVSVEVEEQNGEGFICLATNKYLALERKCMVNAIFNRDYFFKNQGLNLELKCGYLRVGRVKMGWLSSEKNVNFKQIMSEYKDSHGFNLHCWLEDSDGNVYDYIQKYWTNFNPMLKVVRFEGLNKKELLRDFDMEYSSYKDIVCKCFESHSKNINPMLQMAECLG